MRAFFHRLSSLVGVWVLLILLISSVQAQAPGARRSEDAPGLPPHAGGGSAPLATFIVNSPADAVDAAPGNGVCATAGGACTLRGAIQEANALAGDEIISLPAATYTLTLAGAGEDAAATGDLDIRSNLTLTGAGAATTIINGNWADRVLHVTGAFTVNIAGVTITHGNTGNNASGGGIRNDQGALIIANSAVSDNNSGAQAGGILSSGTVIVSNSTFFENNARTAAGSILSTGKLTVNNSVFVDNNAGTDGGAIFSTGTLSVAGSAFSGNNAGSDGGGIFSSGTLTTTGSTFSGNNAGRGGGICDGGGTITITHSTFSGNTASSGAGIFTRFAVTVANSTFSNNDAWQGDVIYTNSGTLTVINSSLFGRVEDPGSASSDPAVSGGGIYNSGGTVTLRNTIIAGHASDGNCVGAITNGGNNLEDGATCGWGSANGAMSNTAPLLGALTGSPAYFPLNLGSPALDAGHNAICAAAPVNNTSQNGVTRPTDGDGNGPASCDIGAFEAPGSVAPTATATRTATSAPTPGATATATPTPTKTRVAQSRHVYLPLVVR